MPIKLMMFKAYVLLSKYLLLLIESNIHVM